MPLPAGFAVRYVPAPPYDHHPIALAVSPALAFWLSEPEARALARALKAECDAARRRRDVATRGD